jgi:hypothetical protein
VLERHRPAFVVRGCEGIVTESCLEVLNRPFVRVPLDCLDVCAELGEELVGRPWPIALSLP